MKNKRTKQGHGRGRGLFTVLKVFIYFYYFREYFSFFFLLVTIFKKFPLPFYTRNVPVFEILKVLFLTLKFPAREKDSDNIIIQNLDTLFTH